MSEHFVFPQDRRLKLANLMKNANRPKPVVERDLGRIVVAAASARFLAASSLRAGRPVSTIDLFADVDTVKTCRQSDQHLFPEQAQNFAWQCRDMDEVWRRVEALVSDGDFHGPSGPPVLLIGGGLESYFGNDTTSHVLPGQANPFGSLDVKQWRHVSEFCSENSIGFPNSSRELDAREFDQGWLVKTDFSSGGLGVQFAQANVSLEPDQFFQKYIDGRSTGACYVAAPPAQGEESSLVELLGVCEPVSSPEPEVSGQPFPFCYAGSTGPMDPSCLTSTTLTELKRVGSLAANHFGLAGVFGIDFILKHDRLWLLEINPRITASAELIEYAARETMPEFSIVDLHLSALAGKVGLESPSIKACQKAAAGGRIFTKKIVYRHHEAAHVLRVTQACIDALEGHFGLFVDSGTQLPASREVLITDVPKPNTDIEAGQPILTLHVSGETHSHADEALVQALDWLERIVGERFR